MHTKPKLTHPYPCPSAGQAWGKLQMRKPYVPAVIDQRTLTHNITPETSALSLLPKMAFIYCLRRLASA